MVSNRQKKQMLNGALPHDYKESNIKQNKEHHWVTDQLSNSVYGLPQTYRTESSKGTRLTCATVSITGTTKPGRNLQSAVTIPWGNAPNHCRNHVWKVSCYLSHAIQKPGNNTRTPVSAKLLKINLAVTLLATVVKC